MKNDTQKIKHIEELVDKLAVMVKEGFEKQDKEFCGIKEEFCGIK